MIKSDGEGMADTYVLEMNHIVKTFPGVRALSDGCFYLKKGEIHALIGENGAGKSTMMKILMGDYRADSGEILYKGQKISPSGSRDAQKLGICIVPQEINIVDTVDVAENIWLGREKQFLKFGLIDKKKRYEATHRLFEKMGISLNPSDLGSELSTAKKQMLTIAKAVSYDADIIILDEPTSSLTDTEIHLLFKVMRELAGRGTGIIFISHKLEEIYEICQRITVMRDGSFIGNYGVDEIPKGRLMTQIAGREISSQYPQKGTAFGKTMLEVEHLSAHGSFKDISFKVKAGEVLGLYGLVGAGRSEIMRAVFGIDHYSRGTVIVDGKKMPPGKPYKSVRRGMAMVTEDRLLTGIISMQSVRINMTLANLYKMTNKCGFIRAAYEQKKALEMIRTLGVKCSNAQQPMGGLSGGNQQKVILGRWMLAKPKLLILDEPTRGIDVGAKAEIYRLITKLASQGMAIVLISSELPEAMGLSNRILVVKDGCLVREFSDDEMVQEKIVNAAFGLPECG